MTSKSPYVVRKCGIYMHILYMPYYNNINYYTLKYNILNLYKHSGCKIYINKIIKNDFEITLTQYTHINNLVEQD
jgi:hypothetical protein